MTMPNVQRPNFPEMYERELVGPLFRPWVDHLLDTAGLAANHRFLDLACGTGIVARIAHHRLGASGRVVGVDLSPLMIGHARTIAPHIEFREGSADALPLEAGEQFDVIACQQGLQFFADKPKAMREMRCALMPGGRVALATWRPIYESQFIAELQTVAERHVGPITDVRHSFGEAGPIRDLLTGVGFTGVNVETHTRTIRFADGATFVRLNAMASAGMSVRGKAMSDPERMRAAGEIVAESAEVIRRYADGAGIAFQLGTNVATAQG